MLWNSDRPSWGAFASRLTPPAFERRAALLRTVDFTAAELTDKTQAVASVLVDGHVDHLHSLTESQAGGDPRLKFC